MVSVVVGGGPAGMFAAIRCKSLHPGVRVILLEKTNQLLSKVRISGGGRCNVTHACFDPLKLASHYPRGSKELVGPFHHFQAKDTVAWFEERGVSLKTESDGRMFPTTDSSETIIQCLMKEAAAVGVEIRKQQSIVGIQKEGARFLIQLKEGEIVADRLILATGSSSWGYAMARQFGHSIIEPVPSLFTFNVPTSPLLDLSGISVPNAILSIKGTKLRQQGPLLLTHWGFSGPAALKLSAWAARELHDMQYKATLLINWTGSETAEGLYQSLLKRKKELPFVLPHQLFNRLKPPGLLERFSNQMLAQLADKLHADAYAIEGKTTYKQEFVTAGGVDLKEIDFKKMESRLTPNLFFAGEILNIDGITGGFNFQNAWTTGWLSGGVKW